MRGIFFSRVRICALILLAVGWGLLNPSAQAKAAKILDLNDSVAANRILTKFAQIVQGSDMGTFLSSRGPFTLFAPTNSAFSKLPPGTLEALLRPENKEVLQRILLLHVVNGKRLTAKDLLPLKTVLSCEGHPLPVHASKSGTQYVMKAKILHADIRCENGLIHEIDTVLLPPDVKFPLPEVAPAPAPAPEATTNAAPDTNAPPSPPTAPADTNAAPVPAPETPAASTNSPPQ